MKQGVKVQTMVNIFIFILLSLGMFLVLDLKLPRRKNIISLSKATVKNKYKAVDERFSRLSALERLWVIVQNTVAMNGFSMQLFWLMTFLAGFLGIILGKFLFMDMLLSFAAGVAMLPVPFIVLKVRARWYQRNQDEMLENTMNLITNSYLCCNDIITAINTNLDKIDLPQPFAEFITEVTLIDSNLRRALLKLDLKLRNKYFSEWVDLLILAQEKSGDYRFILPAVMQGMNDAKRLQIEADTVMMSVWRDYFTSIVLAFSIIPLLRWSNNAWFDILVGTVAGKILLLLMLVLTLVSAFITLKINKPL